MKLIVSNTTDTNVIVSVDEKAYAVKSNERNLSLDLSNGQHKLKVKRENQIPPPNFNQVFWTDFWGILSALFINPWFYIFDVSSTYILNATDEYVYINIVRTEKNSASEGIYDIIRIESSNPSLKNVQYATENEREIISVYNKSKKATHILLYTFLEVIFTLFGMLISYPVLLLIYSANQSPLIVILMIIIPILIMGIIALIGILPLHFLFKYHSKEFYRSMKSEKISILLKENEGKY